MVLSRKGCLPFVNLGSHSPYLLQIDTETDRRKPSYEIKHDRIVLKIGLFIDYNAESGQRSSAV